MRFINEDANIDIDHYLNRYVPVSPISRLPPPIARFLGHREEHKPDVGNVLGAFWSCVGAFCGLVVIAVIFKHSPLIQAHHPPTYIASFGASAILEYNSIRSPLGQPRNALLGHTFSAIVAVGITKLFRLHSDFESIKWIAGALACGVSSALMLFTGTVHPPGGASAVLAATDPVIIDMGWYFVGLVMLGTTLMLIIGLLVNNIQRQFPVYWWTPVDLRKLKAGLRNEDPENIPNSQPDLEERIALEEMEKSPDDEVHVRATSISLPDHLSLTPDEVELLENLRDRLKKRRASAAEEAIAMSTSSEETISRMKESSNDSSSSALQT